MLANLWGNIVIFWSPVSERARDKSALDEFAAGFASTASKKKLTTAERVARDMHALAQQSAEAKPKETDQLLLEEANPLGRGSFSSTGSDSELSSTGSDVESFDRASRRTAKHIQQTKENLRCLEMLLQQDVEDKPLPTVNRFCLYVPWEYVETYADFMRRRVPHEARLTNGIKSEVTWAKFNQRRIDRRQQSTKAQKEKYRQEVRDKMSERIERLQHDLRKEEARMQL